MTYWDVLLPLNLGPLTYSCPTDLASAISPGMVVSVPVKKGMARGIVLRESPSPPIGAAKDIAEVHIDSPVFSQAMLRLFSWMADYYVAPEGLVLKHTVPKEVFAPSGTRSSRKGRSGPPGIALEEIQEDHLSPVTDCLSRRGYRGFLLHVPSMRYEYSFAAALAGSAKGVIILLPEVARAELFFASLPESLGARACLLHGGMPKGKRSASIEGIRQGRHDVVIGTRPSLFAPLSKTSLIIVLHEHSTSYKNEEAVRYHLRDVAVMRGFLEGATVLLSSVSPSVDSYFNGLTKKYSLITPPAAPGPRIRVLNMRFEKTTVTAISKTVVDEARRRMKEGGRVMFLVNRRGYAPALLCRECGHREACPQCSIPLVHHKDLQGLRCHYCGKVTPIPPRCTRCKGTHLELVGAGTQRVQEEIGRLFETEALRFDSDEVRSRSKAEQILEAISGSPGIVVGTKLLARRAWPDAPFSMAAVLNIDGSLAMPDFRAPEKVLSELLAARDLVEKGGTLYVQTRMPDSSIMKCLKTTDYAGFVKEELSVRKALRYPPFSRLARLIVSAQEDILRVIGKVVRSAGDVEILGPTTERDRSGERVFAFLLKAGDRKDLTKALRAVTERLRQEKGLSFWIDVDPL